MKEDKTERNESKQQPQLMRMNIFQGSHNAALIIRRQQPVTDLVRYHHATCFSPVKSTFVKAVGSNSFVTWPGLTKPLIERHLPEQEATALGHMKQERSGLQSTKDETNELEDDWCPTPDTPNVRTKDVVYAVLREEDVAYIDLPGKFPRRSRQGNRYLLICYHYDGNMIWAEPIKSREGGVILKAWHTLREKFERAGTKPNTWVMDNEASRDLLAAINKDEGRYQLVPPHSH